MDKLYIVSVDRDPDIPTHGPWCANYFVIAETSARAARQVELISRGEIKLVQRMDGNTELLNRRPVWEVAPWLPEGTE